MSTRRLLLSAVAAVLTLTALLAIGILLFGRFGETEGRILGTTIFLALFGLLSLPAAILLDQKRLAGTRGAPVRTLGRRLRSCDRGDLDRRPAGARSAS